MMFGMGKLCRYIECDWWYSQSLGEDYHTYTVGKEHVEQIAYHEPQGEGDKHFCDVQLDTGIQLRVFNLNKVEFLQEQDIKLNSLDYLGIPD